MRRFFGSTKGFLITFIPLFIITTNFVKPFLGNIFLILASFLLSIILTPSMVELSKIFGILDKGGEDRKIHKGEIPLLGGIAVALSFGGAIVLSDIPIPKKYTTLIVASFLLLFLGLLDDIYKIPARVRLMAQFFLSLWVVKDGIVLELFPKGELWGISLNSALTIIWIVGFTNAYNFIDGLDGLASGLAIIILSFTTYISSVNGVQEIFLISFPLIGALLGFLIFNFNPAMIFLGDVGASFCGFILSSITADAAWAEKGEYLKALFVPGIILYPLLFDMLQITVFRIKYGFVRSISDWISFTGKDHIHHRLMFIFGHKGAVLFIYLVSFINSSIAVLLQKKQNLEIPFILSIFLTIFLLFVIDKKTSKKAFFEK